MKRILFSGLLWFVPGLVVGLACARASGIGAGREAAVMRALSDLNATQIGQIMEQPPDRLAATAASRELGALLMVFACGYADPASRLHREARLVPAMAAFAGALRAKQHTSGLFDAGNLESPPDTAFILETLCKAQSRLEHDAHAATAAVRGTLRDLILAAAEGVRSGGVHTPNHRWGVCAALAQAHRLYPNPRYVGRIDEWLAEGIDQDADGQFSERSPSYNGKVVDPALVTLAVLLDRPHLLEPVRRNLQMTLRHMEPDGEIEAVASRRQDQRAAARVYIWDYYVPFRYLAIRDGDGAFAAVARRIERDFLGKLLSSPIDPNWPLPFFFEIPGLAGELPPDAALPSDFAKLFAGSGLARIRRGTTSATVFGGSDWHDGWGPASGLSTNPTFFKFRKGSAVLASVRMTPSFFGTGFFYSEGLEADGPRYRLRQVLRVPYYLPLAPGQRNASGDYAMTDDGRFFSKLSFDRRPKQYRTLNSEVTIEERDGGFALELSVEGQPGVPVTIELAFRADGTLQGVESLDNATPEPGTAKAESGPSWLGRARRYVAAAEARGDQFRLKDGAWGRFTAGSDSIEFGPGFYARPPGRMEGDDFTWVEGRLRADGQCVYLTGTTPFRATLNIR